MAALSLLFLGQPRVEARGAEIVLRRRKVLALLAYLAVTSRPHGRDELAELLYPNRDRDHSFGDLRQSLSYLRDFIGESWIDAGPRTISLHSVKGLVIDVVEFRKLLKGGGRSQLAQAARLYRGPFLSGFYLKDCSAFEQWQTGLEESLRQAGAEALVKLVELDRRQGNLDGAVEWARAAVDLDPLEESSHRRLMEVLAGAGRRTPALRQYDRLRTILAEELGETPDEETETLREAIRVGTCVKKAVSPAAGPPHETMETRFHSLLSILPSSVLNSIVAPADGGERLVSVMFTALSDSTAATHGLEPDEAAEQAAGLLRDMVDTVSHFKGRIDRVLGDCVLTVFGTPHAHEDDPERAALSALQIRECARKRGVSVSSAITTGQVRFTLPGSRTHDKPARMDPVLKRATQLQDKAGPGEILIGESAWNHLSPTFECTAVSVRINGIAGHVKAYRLVSRKPRLEKVSSLEGLCAELVGRDEEIAKLTTAYAEALSGNGRIISIIGEAGVGKSRLIEELKARVLSSPDESMHAFWLAGRCIELGAAAAYWPLIDMLGQHFGLQEQEGEGARARHATEALMALQEAEGLSAERAQEIGPLLGRLLSIRFGNAWDAALAHAQPEQIKHQTFLAIRDLLLALARKRPVVAVLDDLHWADPFSIDVITFLMESLPRAPILLLCLYRPETDKRCWQLPEIAARTCPGRFTEILLKELTPSQSGRMIDSLLPVESLPRSVRDLILANSQGNPFFVEEVIRSLIDSGVVSREGDRWQVRQDTAAILVPETLQSTILSRVDRLEGRLKYLLESAAVIGGIFRRRVLEQAQEEERVLDDALSELEERALIRTESTGPGEVYSFKHVLTQQIVYQNILRRRRSRLHGKIADAIESLYQDSIGEHLEQLAHHNDQAGKTGKAVEYLLRAGGKAQDAYLNEAALDHYQRVLDLLAASSSPPDRQRLQALVELGKVYEVIGKHVLAEARLREAAELARQLGCPPRELARIQFLLCKAITTRHRPAEYLPIVEESLRLLENERDSPEAVFAEFVRCYGSFEQGEYRPACEFAARRGEQFRSLPYSQDLAINSGYLAWANFLDKNDAEAMKWLDWLEREAQLHNDLVSRAAAHVRRGRDMLAQRGDLDGAIEELEQASGMYRKVGARYLEGRSYLSAGDVYYRYGRLDPAEECLRRAEFICDELEHHVHMRSESQMLRGQIALGRGDEGAAIGAFRIALASNPGAPWELLMRLLIASALILQGRKEEASHALMALLGESLVFRVPPAYSVTVSLAHVLSMLEVCGNSGEEFRAVCDLVQEKRPESRDILSCWSLQPATPGRYPHAVFTDDFAGPPASGWSWHDPYGDCGRTLEKGCAITAPVGRGMCGSNLSAPRLLRPASGRFALQAVCSPPEDGRLAVGGLALWKSSRDYLRIDVGSLGPHIVAFGGCIGNRDLIIGRGSLSAGPTWLRLERSGAAVSALCSADGAYWYSVGNVDFHAGDPLEVGLFVDGMVRPEIYPRSFAAGSEGRFARFDLLMA